MHPLLKKILDPPLMCEPSLKKIFLDFKKNLNLFFSVCVVLKPRPHVSFYLKTEIFSPGLAYRPHDKKNGLRIRIFSKTLTRVEIPENAAFSFTCGRTKTGVFEYDDVKNYFVFHRFNVLVWTSENNSNALRVDAYYFENGRSPFSEISGYVWMGLKMCGKFLLKVKERMRI